MVTCYIICGHTLSPCYNHQSTGGWSEKPQCQAKMAAWNSFSYIWTRALHAFRSFAIVVHPPPSFLCCLRPPSHHPSSITTAFLVPVPHWLPPSTPFWSYGTHPFLPHAQTISILSDLLYSLTPFLFQLSYAGIELAAIIGTIRSKIIYKIWNYLEKKSFHPFHGYQKFWAIKI